MPARNSISATSFGFSRARYMRKIAESWLMAVESGHQEACGTSEGEARA
jgi:hypothetical protein